MAWWQENKLRLIQNNLRDIDARMDIPRFIHWLKEFGANACMVGCGGISSFYPSALPFQTPSPYLVSDFFGELVEECHKEGIRVIARFDFSKTHERLFTEHPEWFSRSIAGEPVRYHDTVATCVNGDYQQNRSIDILREALERYPVDGVFFNLFGYQTRDYNGSYVGICQCDSCRKRFRAETGMPLPREEQAEDPAFQAYQAFRKRTVDELLRKISAAVREIRPETAVCTYNHDGVDIVRNESNSAVDRPLPFWLYHSEYNAGVVENSFVDKISSNCVINAVDIPYRFMGVSPQLNKIRLYGEIAAGSGLDWCIIGSFEDYPDRENFDGVREVFHYHRQHEVYYGNLDSCGKILLATPSGFGVHGEACREALGIYKMLKEQHLLFDLVEASRLDGISHRLEQYDWVILPGIEEAGEGPFWQAVQRTGVRVLATGLSLKEQPDLLQEYFGVELGKRLEKVRGAYIQTTPKEVFSSFGKREWVYLDLEYRQATLTEGARGYLPLVEAARYGPPERCFGHVVSDWRSMVHKGGNLYLPWMAGTLYYRQGYEDFKRLLLDAMEYVHPVRQLVQVDAPAQVEVFFDRCGEGKYLLQLLNLTGFNGTTFFDPISLAGLRASFPGLEVGEVVRLTQEGEEAVPFHGELELEPLDLYAAYVIGAAQGM